jgi:FHA domain
VDEQILNVSFSGHVAAAIAIANRQCGNLLSATGHSDGIAQGEGDLMTMQRTAHVFASCGALVSLAFYSKPASALGTADIIPAIQTTASFTHDMIVRGYAVAPALMLGLGLLAIMPVMALIAPLASRLQRSDEATRRYKATDGEDVTADITGDAPGIPAHAFLEIVDGSDTRFAILHDMLRIGREDDNDIRIPSNAVHRYHAAIHREYMEDWHITDLSGTNGNGIRVNGQKCVGATLHDGDVIECGPGRLRFRAGHA